MVSAVAGAAPVILSVLALSELFVGRYMIGIAMIVGAVVTGLIFKRIFGWYMELLMVKKS